MPVLVPDVGGGEGAGRDLRVEGDEGALRVVEVGVGGGGWRVGPVGLPVLVVVRQVGGAAGDGGEVGHGGRAGGLDAVIVEVVFVDVVVRHQAGEGGEAVDVGGPEGGEGAVGDRIDEGGGATAELAGGVARDIWGPEEDVGAGYH